MHSVVGLAVVLGLGADPLHRFERLDRVLADGASRPKASRRQRRRGRRSRRRSPLLAWDAARRSCSRASASPRSRICRRSWRAATRSFWTSGTSSNGRSTPRSPRATITPSASVGDLVEVLDTRARLDLDDDPRAVSGQKLAQGTDVVRGANKGLRNEIDAQLERRGTAARSSSVRPSPGSRSLGTLTPPRDRTSPPLTTSVVTRSSSTSVTLQLRRAVRQEHTITDLEVLGHLRMCDGRAGGVARRAVVRPQREGRTGFERA